MHRHTNDKITEEDKLRGDKTFCTLDLQLGRILSNAIKSFRDLEKQK